MPQMPLCLVFYCRQLVLLEKNHPFLTLTSVCTVLVTLIISYLIILSKTFDHCFNLGVKVSNIFVNNHLNESCWMYKCML